MLRFINRERSWIKRCFRSSSVIRHIIQSSDAGKRVCSIQLKNVHHRRYYQANDMHSIKINKRMLFRKPIAFLFIILERDGRKKNIPFRTRRTRNIDPDPTHPKPDKTIHILQSSVYPYQCRWPKPPLTSAVSLNRIELSIVFFFCCCCYLTEIFWLYNRFSITSPFVASPALLWFQPFCDVIIAWRHTYTRKRNNKQQQQQCQMKTCDFHICTYILYAPNRCYVMFSCVVCGCMFSLYCLMNPDGHSVTTAAQRCDEVKWNVERRRMWWFSDDRPHTQFCSGYEKVNEKKPEWTATDTSRWYSKKKPTRLNISLNSRAKKNVHTLMIMDR